MIDLKLWEHECAVVQRGQTLRFNHTDCPAGQDNRRRLYLTRPASSAGMVVAYCHNCQDKGVVSDDSNLFRDFDKSIPSTHDKRVAFAEPTALVTDPHTWPDEATIWRMQKGLSPKQCKAADIAYDPDTHRVYLPMYDKVDANGAPFIETELQGFQLRRLSGTGPKYLNAYKDNEVKPYTRFEPDWKSMVLLVEDFASAMMLSFTLADESIGVVCNYGVKCTPEVLYANRDFGVGVVWLDNDSEHVVDQAHMIAKTWQLISGNSCYVEDRQDDPKDCTSDEIYEVYCNWSAP